MTTVLAFLVTLGVLIVVHEWGHYRVARACGVRVLRFSVGFGRVIWRRQAAPEATEFVVCALPLGGYVRMLDEREAPVPPGQLAQAFNRKSLLQRSAIVAAGPLANLVLAVLLYAAAQWIGIDEPKAVLGAPIEGSLAERAGMRAGDWVREWRGAAADDWQPVYSLSDLRWQITQHTLRGEAIDLRVTDSLGHGGRNLRLALDDLDRRTVDAGIARLIGLGGAFSEAVIGEVKAGGPAAAAGLHSGDRVLRIDDRIVTDAQALRDRIRGSVRDGQGLAMRLSVRRGGEELVIEVTPRPVRDGERTIGRIDALVGTPPELVRVQLGLLDGLHAGLGKTVDVAVLSVKMLGRMLVGQASIQNLSGPLTIAEYAGQSAQQGLAYYLGFLALVSVSLGVLNLLPLPMLDGGHLMYHAFEGLTGRPVSERWLERLQRGGVAVLLLLMSVALYNDVARLLGLHG